MTQGVYKTQGLNTPSDEFLGIHKVYLFWADSSD